jgi:adenylate cyclase
VERVERRLSAVLVADLVGYTEHMHGAETTTYQQVKSDLSTIFEPRIAAHRGRIVKTMGDGILAEFASVIDCVECAMDMQPTLAGRGGIEASSFAYRMAINVGDLIADKDDIYGEGVNVAMRLQGLAEAGSILISEDAYRQAKGKLDVEFDDLGNHAIKGLKEPIRVLRVRRPGGTRKGVSDSTETRSSGALPSLAVLPFHNLTGSAEQGYFSDGITNDIITDLSNYAQIFVISSHTVFAYKDRPGDIRKVSRELGVRYVVEGSVQSARDRVRINVQLIDGASGTHLWARRYDQPISAIFGLQDEIVQTIVGTLVSRLHAIEQQRVRSRPDSLEAYDAFLRGRAAFSLWTEEANREAQRYFRTALEREPNFAAAMSFLSYAIVQSWLGGWDRSSAILKEARELAETAVVHSPEFDHYWSLAAAHLASRNFDKAISAYDRAIALNPNCPNLLVDLAEALVYVGRVNDAIAHVRRAMLLNPIYPDWYLWTLGIAHYHAGEYEEAVAALTKGNPPNLARRHLAAALVRLGRIDEARRAVNEFLEREPGYALEREHAWPYRHEDVLAKFIEDLREAGLPEG